MSGLSGSGKTTVAKQLAIKTGAIVIRSDAVRKHLVGIPLDEKGTNELYTPAMNEKTYQGLLDLGILLAKDGWTVILDAKYDRLNERNKALTLAKSENIPYHIIQCQAPTPVLEERLSGRTGDISDATPDLLKQQLAGFEDFTPDEQAYLTTVETTSSDFFSELERFLSILPEKG